MYSILGNLTSVYLAGLLHLLHGLLLVTALFAALVPLSLHLCLLRLERLAVEAADADALSGVAATLARHVRRKGLHVVPECIMITDYMGGQKLDKTSLCSLN